MNSLSPLSDLLDDCRETTPEWTPVYDAFVAKLRIGAIAATAPTAGDTFPDFALPDERGRYLSLADILTDGPIVLSFNRGGWCPYCRSELSAWGERVDALAAVGGRLVTITGEVGGRAARLHDLVGPDASILCDVDHGLALSVGLAFRYDADLQKRHRDCGLDLADIYGSNAWVLPVPATFVIDRDRTVRFAFADPDFRLRAEPDDVLAVVAALK
jgi:peroxiredoxin